MKLKKLSMAAGISGAIFVGISMLVLVVLSALPGPAAAQALSLGPPHFSPAERPLLESIPNDGIGRHFTLIDHNPLITPGQTLPRGGNGNDIAIVRNCLYASSRSNNQGTLIVDISRPGATKVIGEIAPPAPPPSGVVLSQADLSTLKSENLLVRQVWSTSPPFDGNKVELYDTTNCASPRLVSTIALPDSPHEHFIWQGDHPKRVLLYITFGNGSRGVEQFPAPPHDIDLRVYDITNKANPVGPVATWSLQKFGIPTFELPDPEKNGNQGQSNILHNVMLSADGTRAYLSYYHYGFFILDSSRLAAGVACDVDAPLPPSVNNPFGVNPNACLQKLHPDPSVRLDYHPPFTQSHTHTATKVPNRPYVIINDEPTSNTCPWSWIRIVNVDDTFAFEVDQNLFGAITAAGTKFRGDLFPQQEGAIKIPENIVERCSETRRNFPPAPGAQAATFNAHKSLVFENLIFVSWLAGGVRAFDISNPGMPFETGFYFNKPVEQTQAGDMNPELQIRNYPTLNDGLLYFLDGASGLYILKYTGPRKNEIPDRGLFTQQVIQFPGEQP
jgi:hypothetical protein